MSGLSRRQFLDIMAAFGGAAAMYGSSRALGLIADTGEPKAIHLRPAEKGKNKVVILGGGLAGLSVAYQLQQAGYHCTILEASHRLGGRNLTLRHGDFIDELGNPNFCQFDRDPNLYFNAGPARIPGHHRRLLNYCKEFSVPLQLKANSNRLAYIHDSNHFGGKPVRIGEYIADSRGFLSELVFKSVNQGDFSEEFSEEDWQKLMAYSSIFGDLNEGKYQGSGRSGSKKDRMLEHVVAKDPLKFADILTSKVGMMAALTPENYDWGEPLMEPVGGMDGVVEGFKRNINAKVKLHAQVSAIQVNEDSVDIQYRYKGKQENIQADYCFNNIPAHFMPGISNNFSAHYMNALASFKRGNLYKIAFQMKKRFWEEEGIYGGISFTDQSASQLWYPSHDINSEKGIMLGSYSWDDANNEMFASMTLQQRADEAARCGELIHPGYTSHIEAFASVPWTRMNHMMGCGAHMPADIWDEKFEVLQAAEGRHFMIGDQISHHAGWQEGAFASAEHALGVFNDMVLKA